jgi:hypothetical protein
MTKYYTTEASRDKQHQHVVTSTPAVSSGDWGAGELACTEVCVCGTCYTGA